jgi:hypothetical protein
VDKDAFCACSKATLDRDQNVLKWPALGKLRAHHEALINQRAQEDSASHLPPLIQAQVDVALSRLPCFNDFNISELARLTEQPLKIVTLAAFEHFELGEKLQIDLPTLCAFSEAIEGLYR